MVIIVLIVLVLIVIIIRMKLNANGKFIMRSFESNNTGIFGRKRKGKDVLTQYVIYKRRKPYYANISYGYDLIKQIDIAELKLGDNDYVNFINGTINKIERSFYEKCDIYVSDAGNYLPSQYFKELNQKYKGLSLFLSLQGHTYASNTHFNWNGEYSRLYDKAREQIDDLYRALGRIIIPFFGIFAKYRYFERPQSAELNLKPYKTNSLIDSKQNKALRDQYYATNGVIKDLWIYVPFRVMKYDTRAFEKKIFVDSQRLYKVHKQGALGVIVHKPLAFIKKLYKKIVSIIRYNKQKDA
jgi:hypothetical protein